MQDWYAVKKLEKEGVKIREISRQLNMARNTVKKLMGNPVPIIPPVR